MSSSEGVHPNTLTQAVPLASNELDVTQKIRTLKKVRRLGRNIEERPAKMEEERPGSPQSPLSRIGNFKRQNTRHANAKSLSSLQTVITPFTRLPIVPHFQPLSLDRGTTSSFSSDSPSRQTPTNTTESFKSVDIDEESVMTSNSFAYPTPDLEQLQRDRVAKLSRRLGENIPPELVLRPVRSDITGEKQKRRRSLDFSLTPLHSPVKPSPENEGSPKLKRSRSLWARKGRDITGEKQKRRKSLDFSLTPLHSPAKPAPENEGSPKLKRSRSLWVRKGHTDDPESAADFQKRYDRNFGLQRSMGERQRLLNVKRARKMAQVFGQEPPQELIHVLSEEERSPTLKQGDRDSIHSFSSNLTSPTSIHPVPPFQFATSNISHPTPLETAAKSTAPEDARRSFLPPFVSATAVDPGLVSQQSQTPPIPDTVATFGERRRRAEKLSRFFGVKYQDLSSCAPPAQDFKSQMPQKSSVDVDVQVIGRSRFWRDRVKMSDADVISQLRELKAG